MLLMFFFFFFQAEDGIRDDLVTGVQTCALPITWPGDGVKRTDPRGRPGLASTLTSRPVRPCSASHSTKAPPPRSSSSGSYETTWPSIAAGGSRRPGRVGNAPLRKRGRIWHIEATIRGRRIRESCETEDRAHAIALARQRIAELEQTGPVPPPPT